MLAESHYVPGAKLARFPFSWNMQRDEMVIVEHNLTIENARLIGREPITITITDDNEKEFEGLGAGGGVTIRKNSFELWRQPKGVFHGPKFHREDIVRGYVVILYKNI